MMTAQEARKMVDKLMSDQTLIDDISEKVDELADSFIEKVVSPGVEEQCKKNLFSMELTNYDITKHISKSTGINYLYADGPKLFEVLEISQPVFVHNFVHGDWKHSRGMNNVGEFFVMTVAGQVTKKLRDLGYNVTKPQRARKQGTKYTYENKWGFMGWANPV